MELRAWKMLLLDWVKKCNFEGIIGNISSLEDSNIEAFYAVYVQYASPVDNSFALGPLNTFLKDNYPDFLPNLDCDGRVVPADYIFVYTLLLHYTCVQNPSKYFHNICNNLPETLQQCIASFFEQTVNKPDLTRNFLRQTIVNVNDVENSFLVPEPLPVLNSSPSGHLNSGRCGFSSPTITTVNIHGSIDGFNSLSGSNNKDSTTIDNEASEKTKSLSLTPVQRDAFKTQNDSQIYAPPTPKTELLEQRTREVLGLRAQLETERYEKTVLEEQILENERLINSLSKENTVKKKQLFKLKATLQSENNDEDIYMDNYATGELENLNRRLIKKISLMEADLAVKNEQLQELRTEHSIVIDKLKISEKRIVTCMDQLAELESHIQTSTQLLSEKEHEITCLQQDKLELEQCLQETRNELQNGREVLNASSDLLDTSQLQSSMNTTPENLATSVIDKQLREKEQENYNLREELELNAQEKSRIAEELLQLVNNFQLDVPTAHNGLPSEMLPVVKHSMEQLSFKYKQEQQLTKELQAQNDTIFHQNILHEDNIQKLQYEVEKLTLELAESKTDLLSKNKTLQQSKEEFQDKLFSIHQELEKKDRELAENKAVLLSENKKLQQSVKELEDMLLSIRQELENKDRELAENKSDLLSENKKLQQHEKEFEDKLFSIRQELENKDRELAQIKIELLSENKKLQQSEKEFEDKLFSVREELKNKDRELEESKTDLLSKNLKLQQSKKEFEDKLFSIRQELENKDRELTESKPDLLSKNLKLQQHEKELEDKLLSIRQELENKDRELEESKTDLLSKNLKLQQSKEEFEDKLFSIRQELENKDRELAQIKIELLSKNKKLQQSEKEFEDKLFSIRQELENKDRELAENKADLLSENKKLQQHEKELEDKLFSIRQELENKDREWAESKTDLLSKNLKLQQHEKELEDKLLSIRQELENKDRELAENKADLLSENKKLQQSEKEFEDKLLSIRQELENKDRELAESKTDLLSKNLKLQQHEKELEDKLFSIRQELENKDRELLQINRKFSDVVSLNRSLDIRLNTEMERLTQCNIEKIQLEHKLEEIQSQKHCLDQTEFKNKLLATALKNTQVELEIKASMENSDEKQEKNILLQNNLEDSVQEFCKQNIEHTRVEQSQITSNERQIQMEQREKTPKDQCNKIRLLEQKQKLASKELCVQNIEGEHIEKERAAEKINQVQLKIELNSAAKQNIEHEMENIQLQMKVDSMQQALQKKKHEQEQSLVASKKELEELKQQLQIALQSAEQLSNTQQLLVNEEKRSQALAIQIKQMEVKYLANERDMKDTLLRKEEEQQKLETQQNLTTKRLEKIAIKLGEQQAALSKKQRELAQAKLLQEEQTELIRTLKHEKVNLQLELRQNKERANRAEDKLISLEQQRNSGESELVAKQDRIVILEKKLENAEKMICVQNQAIYEAENEKVRLCLEIGGLNSEIKQYLMRTAEQSKQLQLVNEGKVLEKQSNAEEHKQSQCTNMQRQLDEAKVQLSEALQELDGTRLIHESVQCELDEKIRQLEISLEKSAERETEYKRKLNTLHDELRECNAEVIEIRKNRDELIDTLHKSQEQIVQHCAKAQQLELDCQILQAKYRDAKEEISHFEQKLKDQRLEMDGKLEKMKIKMRTLYTAEVTRMKEKQERDAASTKAELDKHSAQNIKYEEHTRKLSNQIVRLNEKILEQQKQYAVLNTKLRHLQETDQTPANSAADDEWQFFKRPSAPSANLGSNLAMEDEEGEVFNNTYLTDLKLGRVPDMTAEELQYRNSLQPPHLKSAYAAQYDLSTQEDDFKDGQHNLDDSMSTLLSIKGGNGVGTRKKSMGTHYKRPGPPTPSKNGGRLSFGSSDPPREILRETSDNNGSAKTPARFKMFSSRFSMGSSGIGGGHSLPRDERRHRQRKLFLGVQRRNPKHRASGAFCTSTPRKTWPYNDHQRVIAQGDHLSDQPNQSDQPQKDGTPHLSNAELLAMTNGQGQRLSICRRQSVAPISSCSSAAPISNDFKHSETPHISFCLHGNIFAKTRSRVKLTANEHMAYQRLQQRSKMRQQRVGCFDQARHLSGYDSVYEDEELIVEYAVHNDNNNYSTHNHNSLMVMDATLQLKNLSLDYMESDVESVLEQSLDAAATFNIPSITTNATCSNLMEGQQLSKLKALVATNDSSNDTSSVLEHTLEEDQFALQPFQCRNSVMDTHGHNQNGIPLLLSQPVNSVNNLTVTTSNSPPKRRLSNMFKRK
ncbi:hypothetical protein ACLKA6_011372 [Drosophila palustris]